MIVHLVDGTYELFRHFHGRRRFDQGKAQHLGAVAVALGWSPDPTGWAPALAAGLLGTAAFGGLGLLMAGTLPGLATLAGALPRPTVNFEVETRTHVMDIPALLELHDFRPLDGAGKYELKWEPINVGATGPSRKAAEAARTGR